MSTLYQRPRRDYYAILGVSRTASADELRRAYRQQARKLHPDANPAPEAARHFAELAEAYDTLSDPQRRRRYDEMSVISGRSTRSPSGQTGGRPFDRRGSAPPQTPDATYFMSRFDAPYGPDRPVYGSSSRGT